MNVYAWEESVATSINVKIVVKIGITKHSWEFTVYSKHIHMVIEHMYAISGSLISDGDLFIIVFFFFYNSVLGEIEHAVFRKQSCFQSMRKLYVLQSFRTLRILYTYTIILYGGDVAIF
jgi:hypothetical protein